MTARPIRMLLTLLALAAAPATAAGQTVQASVSASPSSAAQGANVTVTLRLDVPGGMTLGAYDGYFRWNPAVLQYQSKIEPAFGNPLTNTTGVGSGEVRFANFTSSGPTGSVTLLTLNFRVLTASGSSALDIDLQSFTNGALQTLPIQNTDGTFTVSGGGGGGGGTPPVVNLSRTSVSFSGTAGGANPGAQTFQVSNGGGGTLSWSVSDNAGWLSASPASGTNTGTVTLSVNASGLAAGTHDAMVTVAASGATSRTVAVTLALSAAPPPPTPVIGLSRTSVSFSATAGGSNPGSQSFQISNTGGGTLSWSVGDNAGWLSASPTSGTNAGTVTLSVSASGLAAGSHAATVTVSAAGASSQTIAVTLTLSAAPVPPALSVSASSLSFSGTAGAGNPAPQSFQVSNSGGGTLSWSVSDNASWLSASPGSGSNGGTVTVSVSTGSLGAGQHNAQVTVSAGAAGTRTVAVSVTLGAAASPPSLALSTGSLSFSGSAGGGNPAAQSFQVSNAGGGTLSWIVSDNASWLSTSPGSGTNAGTVSVSVSSAGLPAGTHAATISVSGGSAGTRTVSVTLQLAADEAPPAMRLSPTSLTFNGTVGGAAPAPQSFEVSNGGGGTLSWSVGDDASWLTTSPSSGTSGGVVTASVDPAGLGEGTHRARIVVSDAGGSSAPVEVTLSLAAQGGGGGVPPPPPPPPPPGGTGPTLGVSTNSMAFTATIDGQSTPQTLQLTTGGDPQQRWVISTGARWIEAQPRSGRGDATVTISLNLRGGTPGIFDGQMRVSASGAANSPQLVNVRLVVSPAPGSGGPGAPSIDLNPLSVRFNVRPFSGVSGPDTFILANAGGGTLNWRLDPSAPWILLSQTQGTGNSQIVEVRVDPTDVPNGSHTGEVRVIADGAVNSPTTLRVTMRIGESNDALSRANVDVISPGSEERVDGYDVVAALRGIETGERQYDVNNDGKVDSADIDEILSNFGKVE